MSDDDKLPPIEVRMGNNNQVDHIGHKITYHAPPPPPNAIRQHGNVVGAFEGQPSEQSGVYRFPRLIFWEPVDERDLIEIQGVKLAITGADVESSISIAGFGNRRVLQNATCHLMT